MFNTTIWLQIDEYLSYVEKVIALSIERLRLTPDERELILKQDLNQIEKRGINALMKYEECYDTLATYPQVLRRSAFVFVMTFLEAQLEELCDLVQSRDRIKFSVRDLARQGTERVALFLERARAIHVKDYPDWQNIDALRLIRNVFVHSNGAITPSLHRQSRANKIASRMSDYVHLDVYPDRAVLVAMPTLAPYAAQTARQFLDHVSRQLGLTPSPP